MPQYAKLDIAAIATGETEPNVTSTTGAVIAMPPGQGRGSPLTSGAGGQRGSPRRIAPVLPRILIRP